MTKEEALNLAMEAITTYLSESPDPSEEAVEGLCDAASVARRTLAQPAPVQEPVGWIDSKGNMICTKINESCKPLYTTPPQRTWVGLTDEEIKKIVGPYGDAPIKGYTRKLFDKIEAALRSKNI